MAGAMTLSLCACGSSAATDTAKSDEAAIETATPEETTGNASAEDTTKEATTDDAAAKETTTERTEVAGTDDISALSEDYKATQKWKVGFCLESMDVAVWNTMSNGMADEAEKLGIDYTCQVANNDVATQVSNIENMIAQGYDAIIIHSFDKEAFATVVNEAIEKGIVVCAYDDQIIDPATGKPCLYPLTFLCDNYEIGYRVGTMAAEWALEQFPDETGDIQFGLLWHHEFEYQQARLAGIEAAIAEKDLRIKIVDEQEGLVTEDGVTACEAWTQAYPDLKGVVATNDTCLLGYAQAWTAAGKDIADENFGMFGNDGVNDAMDMVAEGTIMRGDVGLDVYDGGAMALLSCVKTLDKVDTDSIILPMVSVTQENAQSDWISKPTLYVK